MPWLSALLLLYLVAPVAFFLARSAEHPGLGFGQQGLWAALLTSAEAATISTVAVTGLGTPLAYLLAKSKGRLAAIAGAAVQLPLALPPLMSGVVLLYLFGPATWLGRLANGHFTESVLGIVLAQSFVSSPFLVITARSAFASLDPNLEEVAATAGVAPLRRFLSVAVPLAEPGLRAGMLLTWLRAFGEYGATVMMSYYPLSLPVFTYEQFSSTGLPSAQAPALLAVGLAAAVTALSRLPLKPRRAKDAGVAAPVQRANPAPPLSGGLPAGRAFAGQAPAAVSFKISLLAGDFKLDLAHRSASHRLAVLGASGAGKSLTLKAIAGLLPGEVAFGDRQVGNLPAERRRVGYVPQGQSLLPDRSAWANVMLGPHADGDAAAYWFGSLGITDQLPRLPSQMSGGQRQRVALARALSNRAHVVLLDEPFTGLDAPVRAGLVRELRELQKKADLSTVLVTHDFREAALLSDEVLVISGGRALQAGPTGDVHRAPATPEVAKLLGYRNVLEGVSGGPRSLRADGIVIETGAHGVATGSALTWSVEPHLLEVSERSSPGAVRATLHDVADTGPSCSLVLQLAGGLLLEAEVPSSAAVPPVGTKCWARLPPETILVWPSA